MEAVVEEIEEKPEIEEEPEVLVCQYCGEPIKNTDELDEEYLSEAGVPLHKKCVEKIEEEEKKRQEELKKTIEEETFKGKLYVSKTWKPMIELASKLMNEATFRVKGSTVYMCEMDDSRIAMLRAIIVEQQGELDKYLEEIKESKGFRVNLKSFAKALKYLDYTTKIVSDGAHIHFDLGYGTYSIPILYETMETPEIKLQFKTKGKINLKTEIIEDITKMMSQEPEHIQFTVNKDGDLTVRAVNNSNERIEIKLKNRFKGEEAKATYPFDYIKKLATTDYEWNIEFSDDMPLHAYKTYESSELLRLDFWLAPRIEDIEWD